MKNLPVAFAAALAVALASMVVNYRAYQENHYLEWSYRSHGGEITIEFAPGWHAVHIYAMHPDDQDSHKLTFSPLPLVIFLLVLTLIGRGVLAVVSTGEPWKEFLLLLVGCAVLFFGARALLELWEDYG